MRAPTDAELLAASARDPHVFSQLFERHFSSIYGYLRRRVPDEVASDLAAETFLCAFRARARYRPEHDSARPWLYGIATNLLRHQRRRERRELQALAATARPEQGEAPPERDAELAAALLQLNDGERDVLFLHACADLAYEEIASALDVPVGTVRSRLHRARAKLRELLAPAEAYGSEMDEVEA